VFEGGFCCDHIFASSSSWTGPHFCVESGRVVDIKVEQQIEDRTLTINGVGLPMNESPYHKYGIRVPFPQ